MPSLFTMSPKLAGQEALGQSIRWANRVKTRQQYPALFDAWSHAAAELVAQEWRRRLGIPLHGGHRYPITYHGEYARAIRVVRQAQGWVARIPSTTFGHGPTVYKNPLETGSRGLGPYVIPSYRAGSTAKKVGDGYRVFGEAGQRGLKTTRTFGGQVKRERTGAYLIPKQYAEDEGIDLAEAKRNVRNRKRGKATTPARQRIEQWIDEKMVGSLDGRERRRVAFLILRKIRSEGTQATYLATDLQADLREGKTAVSRDIRLLANDFSHKLLKDLRIKP